MQRVYVFLILFSLILYLSLNVLFSPLSALLSPLSVLLSLDSKVVARQDVLTPTDNTAFLSETQSVIPSPVEGTPTTQAPAVLSPLSGQALQGNVPIIARTDIPGFVSVELSFSYFNNPMDTWFLIYQGNLPVMDAAVAQWDTSLITDGIYTLRMMVYLNDGSQRTVFVPGLRVRNYTPIETETPTPIPPTDTPQPDILMPTDTSTPTDFSPAPVGSVTRQATPLSPNPAELDRQNVLTSVLKGGLAMLGLFALGALYQAIRSLSRDRSP